MTISLSPRSVGRLAGLALVASLSAACAQDSGSDDDDGAGGSGASSGSGGTGGVVEPGPGPLRIGTFNARNVFNDKIDGESFVLDESSNTLSAAEYEQKLSDVATILGMLEADVVMLQEIENQAVLDDLAARPELGREYPFRILVPGNDPRGVDVALLSNVPVTKQVSHKNDLFPRVDVPDGPKYRYARDCLEIHMRFGGYDLVLLGVHFKAKRNDDPDKRLAEAQHTRVIADNLTAQNPDLAVLILGDFNDFPGTPPMDAIDGTASDLYTGAGRVLPQSEQWTVETASSPTGIALHDDLMSNPVLTPFFDSSSVTILHDDDLDPALEVVSDHAPIAATYVIE